MKNKFGFELVIMKEKNEGTIKDLFGCFEFYAGAMTSLHLGKHNNFMKQTDQGIPMILTEMVMDELANGNKA